MKKIIHFTNLIKYFNYKVAAPSYILSTPNYTKMTVYIDLNYYKFDVYDAKKFAKYT